jgi:prevent-host-death family protein
MIVNIKYAKAHLSESVERAMRGEEIIIARGTKPVVRLVPINTSPEHPQEPGLPERLPSHHKK